MLLPQDDPHYNLNRTNILTIEIHILNKNLENNKYTTKQFEEMERSKERLLDESDTLWKLLSEDEKDIARYFSEHLYGCEFL